MDPSSNPNQPEAEASAFNPTPASQTCCEAPNDQDVGYCQICGSDTCGNCTVSVNDTSACRSCSREIREAVANQQMDSSKIPTAIMGGVAGAILAGLAWAAIGIATNMEIGYVAVAIGWLAGQGVVFGAGGAKGPLLQKIAVATSVLGLFLGRYFSFAWSFVEHWTAQGAEGLSYFDPEILSIMMSNITEFFGMWDVLWLGIALSVAWGVPAPDEVEIGEPSEA